MYGNDEYEDDFESADEVSEEAAAEIAASMNELTQWASDLMPANDFARCGTMAAAHSRMLVCDEEDGIDENERDRFIEWLMRLHGDLETLQHIMRQEALAKFNVGDYRPIIRKLTDEEHAVISSRGSLAANGEFEEDDDE